MPILYEPFKFQEEQPRMGWLRTVLLAGGAALTVLGTAAAIHITKGGRPGEGIKGWPRTFLLAGAAGGGVLLTAGAIHFARQAVITGELQSFKVSQRGWKGWVEEI